MVPKFLVCTMWCGEPDYNHCVRSIKEQKDVQIEHRVFHNFPEMEAHNAVYSAFNNAGPDRYLAKIDADVELWDSGVLKWIAGELEKLKWMPQIAGINPDVSDYLTDSVLCAGVAFYQPGIIFKHQINPLKCDRNVLPDGMDMWHSLTVGKHMHHCSELTAFRYGYHRGLKGQTNVQQLVKLAYDKNHDKMRWMALKGFEAAQLNHAPWLGGIGAVPNQHNYGDEELMQAFKHVGDLR